MRPALLLILVWLVLANCPATGRDFQLTNVTFPTTRLSATVFEVPSGTFHARVVATSQFVSTRSIVNPTIESLGPNLGSGAGTRELVVLSGGFNKQDPFESAGLLIEGGRSLSPLSLSKKPISSSRSVYLLSGVLCVNSGGNLHILTVDEFLGQRALCYGAIQAGPLVVERSGQSAITSQQAPSAARLVACERKSKAAFSFYYFDDATLLAVENSLKSECEIALNLAGAIQASISLWKDGRPVRVVGQITTPLPSLLLVY